MVIFAPQALMRTQNLTTPLIRDYVSPSAFLVLRYRHAVANPTSGCRAVLWDVSSRTLSTTWPVPSMNLKSSSAQCWSRCSMCICGRSQPVVNEEWAAPRCESKELKMKRIQDITTSTTVATTLPYPALVCTRWTFGRKAGFRESGTIFLIYTNHTEETSILTVTLSYELRMLYFLHVPPTPSFLKIQPRPRVHSRNRRFGGELSLPLSPRCFRL